MIRPRYFYISAKPASEEDRAKRIAPTITLTERDPTPEEEAQSAARIIALIEGMGIAWANFGDAVSRAADAFDIYRRNPNLFRDTRRWWAHVMVKRGLYRRDKRNRRRRW